MKATEAKPLEFFKKSPQCPVGLCRPRGAAGREIPSGPERRWSGASAGADVGVVGGRGPADKRPRIRGVREEGTDGAGGLRGGRGADGPWGRGAADEGNKDIVWHGLQRRIYERFVDFFSRSRRRMSFEEIPPSAPYRRRERLIIARKLGFVLSAAVSASVFGSATSAATGLPRTVRIRGSPCRSWT